MTQDDDRDEGLMEAQRQWKREDAERVAGMTKRERLDEIFGGVWTDQDQHLYLQGGHPRDKGITEVDPVYLDRSVMFTAENLAEPEDGHPLARLIPPLDGEAEGAVLEPGTVAWPVVYQDGEVGVLLVWPSNAAAIWRAGVWRYGEWEQTGHCVETRTGYAGDREDPDETAWVYANRPAPFWPNWMDRDATDHSGGRLQA